jgi:Fe-S-cluster-containing dehydrogenase component/DMSO reductase anchor subunit
MQAVEQSIFEITPGEPVRLRLVDQYLADQQRLTAVERFAQRHDAGDVPESVIYRDLIPLEAPKAGQQYAFQVNLDDCTGCKACVAACHSLNGLDEDETWRSVGLLHGGTAQNPIQQTVTTACHHCIEPACLAGCPVQAYEKDPLTGIVRHLDDQCIGCQYCIFTCPYEVPQFNAKKGIVRKCDMCSDRLSAGEAPACVQGCPNEAIAVRIIEKKQMIEDAQADQFLPAAPSPGITVPTTTFESKRPFPRNLLPADFYSVRVNHDHLPLVVMLVLTQLSVGAFLADLIIHRLLHQGAAAAPYHALLAVAMGLLALGVAVLHLGRPLYAFRAILGFKTSWMSREIVAFGGFATFSVLYAAALWQARLTPMIGLTPLAPQLADRLQAVLGLLVAATGALSVFSSVMVYHATRRHYWNGASTGFKFVMCAAVLGSASALVSVTATELLGYSSGAPGELARGVAIVLIGLSLIKLGGEASIFLNLYDKQQTHWKRAALLMRGELRGWTSVRFTAGLLGGVLAPLIIVGLSSARFLTPLPLLIACLGLIAAVTGEMFERRLFFGAMNAPRMPGGLR